VIHTLWIGSRRLDRGRSIWSKWEGQREVLARMAVGCWIPADDLRMALNRLPGPPLTRTDVTQRMLEMEEEQSTYSHDDLKAGCLAIYEEEKAQGTDIAAIASRLRIHIEDERTRQQEEVNVRYRQLRGEEAAQRRDRLTSGADIGWTRLQGSKVWYCRTNGRLYRLSATPNKRWRLHRVAQLVDDADGPLIGEYVGRREASAAVASVAYQREVPPR